MGVRIARPAGAPVVHIGRESRKGCFLRRADRESRTLPILDFRWNAEGRLLLPQRLFKSDDHNSYDQASAENL